MIRVFVTGANGHVGANVARSLLQRGYEVVPFVRRTSDLRGLAGLGLTYHYGDIMDVESLKAAMAGCDVVIHAAAVYRFWVKNPDELIQSTLAGVRHLFAAAKATAIKRIVYISTTFTIGASKDPNTLRTPADWNDDQHLPYAIAKVEAEKLAWQLADETGIPLVVLCPNGILGPYDYGITQTTALLQELVNGTGVTGRGGVSFVDVRDVAEVCAQAVEKGKPGQRYIVAGEPITMKALGELITRLTAVKPRHIGAPRGVMMIIATMMELGAKLSGSEPQLSRNVVRELVDRYTYYDCSQTAQDFDFAPRQSEEMVADALRWLLYMGAIKPQVAAKVTAKLPPDPQWQVALA